MGGLFSRKQAHRQGRDTQSHGESFRETRVGGIGLVSFCHMPPLIHILQTSVECNDDCSKNEGNNNFTKARPINIIQPHKFWADISSSSSSDSKDVEKETKQQPYQHTNEPCCISSDDKSLDHLTADIQIK